MEYPTRLKHLESSIERLEELSNDLATRCDGWNKENGDLNGTSDALKRFCETLRSRYEDISVDGNKDKLDPDILRH
jgi:hypothetical protein